MNNRTDESPKHIILIIDDEPANIKILSFLLKDDYRLIVSKDGTKALERAKQEPLPDLILLDIVMPDMDGYEVCMKLKSDPITQDIPVIFVTALDSVEDEAKGLKLGAIDYITKPYNAGIVRARVRTHLELVEKRKILQSMNRILEEKVAERTLELTEANKKLSTLEKAKSDFLNLISHELKTPLNGILGFAALLETSLESSKEAEFLSMLKLSAQRLNRLSDSALRITALNVSGGKVALRPALIGEIIHRAVANMKQAADRKGIALTANIQPQQLRVAVDAELIQDCLTIILDNAIRYSPENEKVHIKAYINGSGDSALVEICDSGPGFSDEAMDRLFGFFSCDQILQHKEGLGLGLATVKLIMDAHSGKVSASNKDDGGASTKLIFSYQD